MRTAPVTPPIVRLGLLAAVVLLAAGCGSSGTPEPPDPAPRPPSSTIPTDAPPSNRPSPAAPDPLVATPPPGASALAGERVDATGLPAGLPTLVWTRDDRVVGVYGRGGGCTDARLEVVEQGERVVLRVVQFSTGPGPCTRELVYPPLEATLDAPLGERPVVLTGEVP
ncbi:hypothetical protein [Actinomycetospora straminea]|uniref:Uncharacterized protein n=1 Tax=Actinomycetospora straminea TaxID=663607 RepID=A0ABP9EUH9_9PSEU|nr:hypothetical protein [Actinomycetospora straminea]MDD7931533.1 hypothetical protein [Actinomycetospora straminea]